MARVRAESERAEDALGEVVVTAPPVADLPAVDAPTAFATVLDTSSAPAEVETLADALSETVGVQVRRFGGLGDFSTVSIRGYGAGQVQVYLDGVPLSRADNEVVNLADLPLDAVGRVEVYRGMTPLAFAQSAPGGVVNIVPRRPGETPTTAASTSVGSFATRKVDLLRSARSGPWEYLAFAHYLGSAGDFTFTNDLATPDSADDRTERRVNNAFNLGDLTTRVGYRPAGALSAVLTTDTFARAGGVPGAGVAQARDTSLRTFRQLANLELRHAPVAALPIEARGGAYVLHERQDFDDPKGELGVATETDDRSTAAGIQGVVRAALGAHQVPGVFAALGHEGFASEDRLDPAPPPPDRTRLRGTLAAEDELVALGDRVTLVPGVRWEIVRDDFPGDTSPAPAAGSAGVRTDDFVSPRIGLRLLPLPGLALLGNIGRYARVPSLNELFGTSGVLQGNPDLQPEEATNRDMGFRVTAPPVGPLTGAGMEYAYFDNTIDDLIVLQRVSLSLVKPVNVARATIRGHEVAVRGRLWNRLGLTANYTRQEARDASDVARLHGKQLPGRPDDEAYARAELGWSPAWPLPLGAPASRIWPGSLYYEVNALGSNVLDTANVRRVPSRVVQGVGIAVRLPLGGLRVAFEVKNVGNDQTEDVLGFPLPGRAFFGTVSWGFGEAAAP